MAYIPRLSEQALLRLSRQFPAVLLTGPRQVGKSTLLLEMAKREGRSYVSLDEFGPRQLAQSDPELFLQSYPPPAVIDEIQHGPGLLTENPYPLTKSVAAVPVSSVL